MSLLSQFFGGNSSRNKELGSYGVGLATGFSEQILVDIMLIGGGGGGGNAKNTPFVGVTTNLFNANADRVLGGGGGAGRNLIINECVVDVDVPYPISIGAGGAGNARGGTTSFGILRSGGGGAGGGTTPDGTPVITDSGLLYGGSSGGTGISTGLDGVNPLFLPLPAGTYNPPQLNSYHITGGTSGKYDRWPTGPNDNFDISIFKQYTQSRIHPSISPLAAPFSNTPNSIGLAEFGRSGGTVDNSHNAPGPSAGPLYTPASPVHFWNRIDPTVPAYLNPAPDGGRGGGGTIALLSFFHPGPSFTYFTSLDDSYLSSQGPAYPAFFGAPGNPGGPKNLSHSLVSSPSSPQWNVVSVPSPGPHPSGVTQGPGIIFIPPSGGNFSGNPLLPSSFPGGAPIAAQTTKSISWTTNPASVTGSPTAGAGGGGGARFPPTVLQGTYTQIYRRPSPSPPNPAGTIQTAPYALSVAGTTTPMASGGAGGSGSVWIIYPSDYAAATVTGDTPVPSPPAVRIYRFDGSGTIKFNAS